MEDNSYQRVGRSGLLASNRSSLVEIEISIQRRICELSGSSLAKDNEPPIRVKSPLTGPTGLDLGDDSCFTGKTVEVFSNFCGKLNRDRQLSVAVVEDRRRKDPVIEIKEGIVICLRL